MDRRLFLAVSLSDEAVRRLREIRGDLELSCPDVKWTRDENLHVTVVFLGNVPEQVIDPLCDGFSDVLSGVEPFSMIADRVTAGPPDSLSNMLWLGFQEGGQFSSLVKKARDVVNKHMDIPPPRDPIIPHVTLARGCNRMSESCNVSFEKRGLNLEIPVASCVLMESHLFREGSKYMELEKFPLNGNR
jgi:2'-5' RNA ligase